MENNRKYQYRKKRKKQRQKSLLLFCLLICFAFLGALLKESNSVHDMQTQEDKAEIQDADAEISGDEPQKDEDRNTGETLEVHFIDVGQGDAVFIKCGEHAMLIDAGDNSKGSAVQLYLTKQGVSKLDYVIGTHPDADHIGGLDVIITKFDCNTVIMPETERDTATYRDVIMAMEYKGYQNTPPVPGDSYQLGEAVFTIIAPNRDYGEDYNNASVGLLLCHGDNRFIFTGDAESEAEEDMLLNGIDLSADVMKAGHHGSSSSGSAAFLDAVNPKYVVISCGEGNSYGHPHAEFLNALRERGVQVFRTDEQGSIAVTSDGKNLTWNCAPSESWRSGFEAESRR